MFFEGPEKKLELAIRADLPSLRKRGRAYWDAVVRKAKAKILSQVSSDSLDAYLLSESSLFVHDHWLTLITCGQTDLVSAALKLTRDLGLGDLRYLIYERKNAQFQEYQPSNFFDDARRLGAAMPGRAFRFGEGADHHLFLFHLDRPYRPDAEDRTLELLMHGIDPSASRTFMAGAGRAQQRIRRSGVWDILPGFKVDDHLFNPMGYSLNAVRGSKYYTIHVTPQPIGSYVSFETNCLDTPNKTVARVLEIFRPQSCALALFQPAGAGKRVRCAYPVRRLTRQRLGCGYDVEFWDHYKAQAGPMAALEIVP